MFLRIVITPYCRSAQQLARCVWKHCRFNTYSACISKSNWNALRYPYPLSLKVPSRSFSVHNEQENRLLTPIEYEQKCNETLDSLSECFEQLIEESPHLKNADVCCDDGILTVKFGDPYGTYVINRQTPNLQIWLSSPTSGPKRYDYKDSRWVYRHDGISLHELLNNEISKIVGREVDFSKCAHSGSSSGSKS